MGMEKIEAFRPAKTKLASRVSRPFRGGVRVALTHFASRSMKRRSGESGAPTAAASEVVQDDEGSEFDYEKVRKTLMPARMRRKLTREAANQAATSRKPSGGGHAPAAADSDDDEVIILQRGGAAPARAARAAMQVEVDEEAPAAVSLVGSPASPTIAQRNAHAPRDRSLGQAATPFVAPPEAQGKREAWPEAALVCMCRTRSCPTSITGDGRTRATGAVFQWPSQPAGQLRKPQATKPRAIGPNGSGPALTAALPACVPASPDAHGKPGLARAPGLCHAALDVFPLPSGTRATICRSSASPTTSTSVPTTCARCHPERWCCYG